jgi:hypothetical protein
MPLASVVFRCMNEASTSSAYGGTQPPSVNPPSRSSSADSTDWMPPSRETKFTTTNGRPVPAGVSWLFMIVLQSVSM